MNLDATSKYLIEVVIPAAVEYYKTRPHPMDSIDWESVFASATLIEGTK